MPSLNGQDPVSVVISTRNRPGIISSAVASIFANSYDDYEVVVVDQSDDDSTQVALRAFSDTPCLRYIRSAARGLGAGHNVGIREARHAVVAITDDDCLVPENWLRSIMSTLQDAPQVGVLFGQVVATDTYRSMDGFVPVFTHHQPQLFTNLNSDLAQGLGIGACLVLRRSVWESIGGFDEMLGPGAPLGSLEDRDFALRALIRGIHVYYAPDICVVHFGFREQKDVRGLAFHDWFGFGSCTAKFLKCGKWQTLPYLVSEMWRKDALLHAASYSLAQRRLRRVTPVLAFWIGVAAGLVHKVDHGSMTFRRRGLFNSELH